MHNLSCQDISIVRIIIYARDYIFTVFSPDVFTSFCSGMGGMRLSGKRQPLRKGNLTWHLTPYVVLRTTEWFIHFETLLRCFVSALFLFHWSTAFEEIRVRGKAEPDKSKQGGFAFCSIIVSRGRSCAFPKLAPSFRSLHHAFVNQPLIIASQSP